MELSLFSRDVIAMSTAVALSHDMFDAALMPRRLRQDRARPADRRAGASATCRRSSCPPGPMTSGLPNEEKARIRQLLRRGQGRPRRAARGRDAASYHGAGHLHLLRHRQLQPDADGGDGPAPARRGLRPPRHAAARRADRARRRSAWPPITAQGGELHAGRPDRRRAGDRQRDRRRCSPPAARPTTRCTWSRSRAPPASASTGTTSPTSRRVVPLLARVYPNGKADVNHFHAAGGMGFVIRELLDGRAAARRRRAPSSATGLCALHARAVARRHGTLRWRDGAGGQRRRSDRAAPRRRAVQRRRRPAAAARQPRPRRHQDLGGASPSTAWSRRRRVVFDDQDELLAAFEAGELDARLRRGGALPGPARQRHAGAAQAHAGARRAAGPRLQRVALVTDGRMSGASGKVPAAIHVTPEAAAGGLLARVRNGDVIRFDARAGSLDLRGQRHALAGAPAGEGHLRLKVRLRAASCLPVFGGSSAKQRAVR